MNLGKIVRCPRCHRFFNEDDAKDIKDYWGKCPHCDSKLSLAQLDSVASIFYSFQEDNPNWKDNLTDLTYYKIRSWYSEEFNCPFDIDKGYSDEVKEFTEYVWKEICPQEHKETITIDLELFKKLLQIVDLNAHHTDDAIRSCEKMTSGNFMHNKSYVQETLRAKRDMALRVIENFNLKETIDTYKI